MRYQQVASCTDFQVGLDSGEKRNWRRRMPELDGTMSGCCLGKANCRCRGKVDRMDDHLEQDKVEHHVMLDKHFP